MSRSDIEGDGKHASIMDKESFGGGLFSGAWRQLPIFLDQSLKTEVNNRLSFPGILLHRVVVTPTPLTVYGASFQNAKTVI